MVTLLAAIGALVLSASAMADECNPGDVRDCTVAHGSGYMPCP